MVDVFPILKTRTHRLDKHPSDRLRSEPHRRFVASLPCCICGGRDVQAHHLLCAPEPKAKSLKPSDGWCVPVCVGHHAWVHSLGREPFDPQWLRGIARRLWCASVAIGRAHDPDLTASEAAREAGDWEAWVRRGYQARRAA